MCGLPVKEAAKSRGKPKAVTGKEAIVIIEGSEFVEDDGEVVASDPLGLVEGDAVEVWPTDSRFNHKDRGRLVRLCGREVATESRAEGGRQCGYKPPGMGSR